MFNFSKSSVQPTVMKPAETAKAINATGLNILILLETRIANMFYDAHMTAKNAKIIIR